MSNALKLYQILQPTKCLAFHHDSLFDLFTYHQILYVQKGLEFLFKRVIQF